MSSLCSAAAVLLGTLLVTPGLAHAQRAAELPVKFAGKPTTAAITPADLMTRVYVFADDSMMGRQVGTEYNLKGTAYIEREVRRLGLVPAGDDGYYQHLPLFVKTLDSASTLTVEGRAFRVGDFITQGAGSTRPLTSAEVVYGGMALDTTNLLTAEQVNGRIVVLRPFTSAGGLGAGFAQSSGYQRYVATLAGAAGIAVAGVNITPNAVRNVTSLAAARAFVRDTAAPAQAITLLLSAPLSEALFGGSLDTVAKGTRGKAVTADIRFREEARPGRNVVAILRGSDPRLRGQYVAVGAHNDHIGFNTRPVDHDSIRALNIVARPQGADSPAPLALTPEQTARIRSMTDSLRALHPARLDSIFNGADDDASGSMSVLEVAEAMARSSVKPKRSIIFVWHTGEEAGLWGSEYFTDHPTVPRDSIVAQLNMDMVGRGAASDVTGELKAGGLSRGGAGYVQLVGSRRLSTELGDLVESVNKSRRLGFNFDYSQDENGHPQNINCRSDHYSYARYGIPVTFFTTGGHSDYHQVTDEPQYIDYTRLAQVTTLVRDAAMQVANLDHRVAVDKEKPDPRGRCVQ